MSRATAGYKTFDREMLRCVARTSLGTKVTEALAEQLTDIVTDAVTFVRPEEGLVDLHMVRAQPCRYRSPVVTRSGFDLPLN